MSSDPYEVRPLPRRDSTQPIRIRVPGSKSITNRSLPLAALADGDSALSAALFSDDTKHMAACLRQMGVDIEERPEQSSFTVHGTGGRLKAPSASLFVGNAGTAARFLTAAVCLGRGRFVIDGTPRMRQRPIGDLVDALRQLGAKIECPSGCPPVTVDADGLRGGAATVKGNISSQYLSALLMVAPYAERDVTISVKGELIARPYVDMTIEVMRQFGVKGLDFHAAAAEEPPRYRVRAGQLYEPRAYAIEPDASSAHYFLAAAALTDRRVCVDLPEPALQGDAAFAAEVLAPMGAAVERSADRVCVEGRAPLSGIDVDVNRLSDTAPTAAVLAAFANSPSHISGIRHLRQQESDRVAAVVTELTRLGGDIRVDDEDDGWMIRPSKLHGGEVETYDDHRIAMAFALVGLKIPGVTIRDPDCVNKTFPGFFEELEKLRQ